MLFKSFFNLEIWRPPVRSSGTIYANLVVGIMGNIHVKFNLNLDQWFRRR